MKAPKGYNDAKAQEGGYERPKAGGYIMKCVGVEVITSRKGNPMLILDLDICQGQFKDHYKKLYDRFPAGNWPLRYYQLLTEEQAGRYKGVVESFAKSNQGFPIGKFAGDDHDEKAFIGQMVGAVMREEEYEKKDGTIGSNLKIFFLCSTERIEKGNFKAPEKKTITGTSSGDERTVPPPSDADCLPF